MLAQLLVDAQLMSQGAVPQVTGPHALLPAQLTVQAAASVQSIASHALFVMQLIVQSNPAGQLRLAHSFAVSHVTTQVRALRSHD